MAILLNVACNQKPKKNYSTETATEANVSKEDKDLMTQAQGIFKALPVSAESATNPITAEKVKLGKLLYFDMRLSMTGKNSCNSCHNLATFGVDNLPTSKGDAGIFGDRNSPTVFNAAFHAMQFWDGRAKDVEEQAGGPILNPVEMAIPSKEFLVKRLKGVPTYIELFKAAFPNDKDPLTYTNIQNSIGAFERTLVTPSPFDKYLEGDHGALTDAEKEGLKAFVSVGCIACHSGVAIGAGAAFQKFGVFGDYRTYTKSKVNDEGRKKVTNSAADKDFFKVPSLRNIAKTAPYFHDGSISDLKQAVAIMGKAQLNKDLTDAEIDGIVAFLGSLTGTVSEDVKKAPESLATN